MKQVVYIHGGEAFSHYEDFIEHLKTAEIRNLPGAESYVKWTKHLAEDLGEGYEVFMPQMPNSDNAKYEEWKIWFERYFAYLKDGVVFVGCSLGAMFLAKYFCENQPPCRVAALILMAGAVSADGLTGEDGGDFLVNLEAAGRLAERAGRVIIMHSKDDFVVPYEHGERLQAAIPGSEFISFADKNHFLVPEFPEFIELVKNL